MKKILSLVLALVMIFTMATTAFADETTDETVATATDDSSVYVKGSETITITNKADDGNSDISSSDNTWKIGVEADVDTTNASEDKAAKVYYVVVKWEVESSLIYKLNETAYSWNVYADQIGEKYATEGEAQSAGYELDYEDGTWTGTAKIDVSITNWSNADVTYSVSFAAATVENDTTDKIVSDIEFATGAVTYTDGEGTLTAASAGTADETTGLYTAATTTVAKVDINAENVGNMKGAIKANDALIGVVTVTLSPVTVSENNGDPGSNP